MPHQANRSIAMNTYSWTCANRVMLDFETVTLTRMEYRLLALLVKRAGGGCTSIDSPKGDRTLGCAPVAVAEETGEIR